MTLQFSLRKVLRISVLVGILFIVAFMFMPEVTQAQFDFSKGVVGNLPAACRDQGKCDFCDFIALFIVLEKMILSLFGGLAIVMFIWGGQGLIMAAGNEEKIGASKKLLTSTIFGILIILAGYFLVAIIVNILANPTTTGGGRAALVGTENWWKGFCEDRLTSETSQNDCATKPVGDGCGSDPTLFACTSSNECRPRCERIVGPPVYGCQATCGGNTVAAYCPTNQVCCQQ